MGIRKFVRTVLLDRQGGKSILDSLLSDEHGQASGGAGKDGGTEASDQGQPVTVDRISEAFKDIDDVDVRHFFIEGRTVYMVLLTSIVQDAQFQQWVFTPLKTFTNEPLEQRIAASETVDPCDLNAMVEAVLSGYTLLFFIDSGTVLKTLTYEVEERAITFSENESTIMGPQDSFTDTLEINLSLIKRRLRSPELKTKKMKIGVDTQTSLCVLYMNNIVNPENLERVMNRLKDMRSDGYMTMAKIRQLMEDSPFSPFPQNGMTTRPDLAIFALLQGKIVLLSEGSPDSTMLPATFLEMFVSPDDTYSRWITASMLRSLRVFGFFLTILLSSFYVSILTFHPEMLPPPLLKLLSESRTKVPFPPVIEVLIIELVIDILREAGTRMPTKIGQTIGIVGGIVIGTAAVQAGLASNILIVIVATSALLSFLPTNYLMSSTSRVVRYIYILLAGMMGLYGQSIAFAGMMAHLSNLTSIGTPYFSPIPRKWSDMKNSFIRLPFQLLREVLSAARPQRDGRKGK